MIGSIEGKTIHWKFDIDEDMINEIKLHPDSKYSIYLDIINIVQCETGSLIDDLIKENK